MKITHCISSIDQTSGGPAELMRLLLNKLSENENIDLRLETLQSGSPFKLSSKVETNFHFFNKIRYSATLYDNLKKSNTQLFHGNGLWGHTVHQMVNVARLKSKPYVLSIHGCLDPLSLYNKSYWKKYIAFKLYQHKDLKFATCLHATSKMEMDNIRSLGYTNPIANIPNGIDLNEYILNNYVKKKLKRKILFLSRIHPQKGIEFLISAWEQLEEKIRQNWEVEIAGNGEPEYIKQLNELIKEKSLQNQIHIVGPKFGKDKIEIYQSADLFVLPTYSENFGIVIAEALASGVPVITTTGTPWEELETYQAGKWIDLSEENLANAMSFLMNMNEEQLQEMGSNGRKLIEENYSIESVAEKFILLYQWIITGENKPKFVSE